MGPAMPETHPAVSPGPSPPHPHPPSPPHPHPLASPVIVGLLVFGSVVVVGVIFGTLAMVAMRPTVNVADLGSRIDNSPSAQVEVRPTVRLAPANADR